MTDFHISPDIYKEERFRQGSFVCDICQDEWPLPHMRKTAGGLRVGYLCCFEPEGDEVARDRRRAFASRMAARLAAKEAMPKRGPDGTFYRGIDPLPALLPRLLEIDPKPIVLSRGGAAVPATLTGEDFSASDTIAYGSSGITDSTSPVRTGTTSWAISVRASVSMNPGFYTLRFNDSLWQRVFDVR